MQLLYRIAADLVVTLHALYVLVVVFGFIAIVAGIFAGWRWIRNPWFRYVHLAMILLVVAEVWCGITCPLTVWERQLRALGGETTYHGAFLANLVHEWLFYEAPEWVFNTIYTTFGLLVLLTFILAPPRSIRSRKKAPED
ncbi:hypothetical protein Mal4_25630 [Maioricimonas rarisocia]|uniref:DUF2784 domain-containing protein n=1 Tax=Maioricimonas rarisocia TaxID=2528026 RepID=A0A517Z6X2_9PLAN|nr:DUF2784 domain-containing protein [Maioricimonas rarisocia]QDU38238.1 hypothetical protein Mal4_25630 [Maioricimonas rarisocia]